MKNKLSSISLSLIMLSATCTSVCANSPSSTPLCPEATLKAQISLESQITQLRSIALILIKVKDNASANAAVAPVTRAIAAYNAAELQWEHIEDTLTSAQEKILEKPYEHQLDKAEDKVEDIAERLYEDERCYGSTALMDAIRGIAD